MPTRRTARRRPTRPARTTRRARLPPKTRAARTPRFVGRDPSPVLDRYPPKDPALSVGSRSPLPAPVRAATPSPSSAPLAPPAPVGSPTPGPGGPAPSSPGGPLPLIRLDRPFDLDEFSSLLGETTIRVTVPREELSEVLRRITEFMGFGIYVYAVSIRPSPSELLTGFVVELQRVDYSAEKGTWVPFVEKGTSDSPFGASGGRT